MSGHETIRVLEVEVDSSTASSLSDDKVDSRVEGRDDQASKQPDASSIQDTPTATKIAGGAGNFFQMVMHCNTTKAAL